ncbi:hypothetical protein [Dyella sp. GSA-30]|uniref:hypothetical protein n=1 Tax=Dyella sp. GSA-30 TaxID=2994496 RepID=UPI0024936AAA|nr:hypothetical protein [Dyella sp. GSA-30]BDU21722.1 hypothetical protein DYGSA30_31790 [Dyella sp. GSA-30]
MLPIVNARGVPGCAGALARGADGARYLVSCYHVLYGHGATSGDPVFAMDESTGRRRYVELGCTVRGFIGHVDGGNVDGQTHASFVDCAIVTLDKATELPPVLRDTLHAMACPDGVGHAERGSRAFKDGWISGRTEGVVVDTAHYERPFFEDGQRDSPGQILIQSLEDERAFSVAGESGSAVFDERRRLVGFLWACNAAGESIAFPAQAALRQLGVTVESTYGRGGDER